MDPNPTPQRPGAGPTMRLPPGVVANAPYQGASPVPPGIPIPLTSVWAPRRITSPDSRASAPSTASPRPPQPAQGGTTPHGNAAVAAAQAIISPSALNAAALGLTAAQLYRITGGRAQEVRGNDRGWSYGMRRSAQSILDFIYLGPSTAARDTAFLQREAITKVVAVRDSRLAMARLMVVEHTAKALGIASECLDVSDLSDLIRALPHAVHSINRHMLEEALADAAGVSTGRVLVFCETGNLRSAAVVAAYIMAMYGTELVETLQFVNRRRFCTSLDEDGKHMLQAWGEILHARRDVAQAGQDAAMADDGGGGGDGAAETASDKAAASMLDPPKGLDGNWPASRPSKRRIADTMDLSDDDDRMEGFGGSGGTGSQEASAEQSRFQLDMARYQDRKPFTPFTDMGHGS